MSISWYATVRTLRELERRGVNLSRVEEQHPDGWLGRVKSDPSEKGAFTRARDEPTAREERES